MAFAVVVLLAGCTRVVYDAQPLKARPVGPIAVGQVDDLLSENADASQFPRPYAPIEPAKCAAVVQEVRAPFIFDATPAAHSGGYWLDEEAPTANVVEIVGVYHSDFDPAAALDGASRTVESCRNVRVEVGIDDGEPPDVFRVLPLKDSGSPQIVHWSLHWADGWTCDNAFVAAHNAAIEITACAESRGYDVLQQARFALERIEKLANATT